MPDANRFVVPEITINWGAGTDADTSAYNDVSRKFLLPAGVRISWGRDQARSTSPAKIETLDMTLDNTDGVFSNVAGPLAGFITRGPTVIAYLTLDYEIYCDSPDVFADDDYYADGTLRQLIFDGKIDNAAQIMDSQKSVTIRALGRLSAFNKSKVTIPLQENVTVDQILGLICDEVDFPVEDRDFDTGDTTILYWWAHDRSPLELMYELTPATEGSNSAIYMAPGVLHFEGRQYRQNATRSTTPQYYLYDSLQASAPVGQPIYYNPPTTLNQNVEEVYNVVKGQANYRTLGTLQQVWSYGASITLGANETKVIYASMSDPVKDAQVPNSTDDYTTTNPLASVTISATSGSRIAITLVAGASGAIVTGPTGQTADGIYLRAKPLQVSSEVDIVSTIDTQASIDRYDRNEYDLNNWPEINPNNVQDIVNGIARRYQEPRDQITIRVFNVDAYHTTMIMDSKISDRIHISSVHQGIDNDFFIESKTIELLGNGNMIAIFDCERAIDQDAFRFGVNTFGPYDEITNPLALPFGE